MYLGPFSGQGGYSPLDHIAHTGLYCQSNPYGSYEGKREGGAEFSQSKAEYAAANDVTTNEGYNEQF
jgi:hypothetical protein